MTKLRALTILALPLVLLAACHDARQPGTTTPAEDKQLDDAAAMQDARSMEVNAAATNDTDEADSGDGNEQ